MLLYDLSIFLCYGIGATSAVEYLDVTKGKSTSQSITWEGNLAGYYLIDDIKVHNQNFGNFNVTITNDGKEVWKYQQTGNAQNVKDIDVSANIKELKSITR